MNKTEPPYLETRRDQQVTLRLVVQFDSEDGWHYFLNGIEISSELHAQLQLPF